MEHERKFPVVLLAAGAGSRMGHIPKGLLDFRGRRWIEAQIDKIIACGCDLVVVVLGSKIEEFERDLDWVRRARRKWIERESAAVKVVVNAEPDRGTFSSVVLAMEELRTLAIWDAAFLLPVDVPCCQRNVWELLKKTEMPQRSALVPRYQNHGGHPVGLEREFALSLVSIPLDSPEARLDKQIKGLESNVKFVDVDDSSIVENLNTQEDWSRFLSSAAALSFEVTDEANNRKDS